MRLISLILALLLTTSLFGQDKTVIQSHKFYDTTKVEDFQRVKSRRLTTNVDSTGIAVYAWGDECYFKITLLDESLLTVISYDISTLSRDPYVKYGDDDLKYKMYVNKSGNFEFDAIIESVPLKDQHEFQFKIQSKGLRFLYQDSAIITNDPNASAPDSVLNSYAVYHSSEKHNIKRIDGVDTIYENYGTGKAFHIYRPKVWDSAGDTVWGYVNIDVASGLMTIGADSVWMTKAIYPVTIDPEIGVTTVGGTALATGSKVRFRRITMPEAGILDSIVSYTSGYLSYICFSGIYDEASGVPDDLLEEETTGYVPANWGTGAWHDIAMAGTLSLSNSTNYWLALVFSGGDGEIRIYGDYEEWHYSEVRLKTATTSFPDPAGTVDYDDYELSIHASYSTGGGADPQRKRRRRILQMGGR